jgi:hypothetical protein
VTSHRRAAGRAPRTAGSSRSPRKRQPDQPLVLGASRQWHERGRTPVNHEDAAVDAGSRPERRGRNAPGEAEVVPRPPARREQRGAADGRALARDLPLQQEHGADPRALAEQVAQHRGGDGERDVRDDVVCRVEAEPEHVGLHDADPAPEGPPEPGDAGRIELDGHDVAVAGREPAGQGAVTGTELEDGTGWHQRGDARHHAAVDEEVLTEFVRTTEGTAGGRWHDGPALRIDRERAPDRAARTVKRPRRGRGSAARRPSDAPQPYRSCHDDHATGGRDRFSPRIVSVSARSGESP